MTREGTDCISGHSLSSPVLWTPQHGTAPWTRAGTLERPPGLGIPAYSLYTSSVTLGKLPKLILHFLSYIIRIIKLPASQDYKDSIS